MTTKTKTPNYTTNMVALLIRSVEHVSDFETQKFVLEQLADGISDLSEIPDGVLKSFKSKTYKQLLGKLSWLSRQTGNDAVTKKNGSSVYVPKVYTTKNKGIVVSKSELVTTIEKLAGLEVNSLDSLEKSNKAVLSALKEVLSAQISLINEFEGLLLDQEAEG